MLGERAVNASLSKNFCPHLKKKKQSVYEVQKITLHDVKNNIQKLDGSFLSEKKCDIISVQTRTPECTFFCALVQHTGLFFMIYSPKSYITGL